MILFRLGVVEANEMEERKKSSNWLETNKISYIFQRFFLFVANEKKSELTTFKLSGQFVARKGIVHVKKRNKNENCKEKN